MTAFNSILAVQGAGTAQDAVVAEAVRLAQANGAALTVVDVIERHGTSADDLAMRRARLAEAAETARQAGLDASEAVLHGDAAVEVIRMVLREGHDLVVALTGPVAEGLVRDCPCPVLVVKPAGFSTPVTLHDADATST
ncbi:MULTISPECIES: universal stress protein [Roseicyclus]|jgi:nucleotide-binding universal stress UspA family protein|uniref:universal stress protein n=1 Tax=Roseicyclus amphidinii TaxID=3034232 RepID=UPI0024E156D7|nr:universal stress protein [Roseicyclus sp. Amp-Y-6]